MSMLRMILGFLIEILFTTLKILYLSYQWDKKSVFEKLGYGQGLKRHRVFDIKICEITLFGLFLEQEALKRKLRL